MSKIKVKLSGGGWPPEYNDKEVEVQVNQITLPDGGMWTIDEYSYKLDGVDIGSDGKVASMKELVGQNMTRLNIEFM